MATVDDTINAWNRNRSRIRPEHQELLDLLLLLRRIRRLNDRQRRRISIALIRNEWFEDYEDPSTDPELGNLTHE